MRAFPLRRWCRRSRFRFLRTTLLALTTLFLLDLLYLSWTLSNAPPHIPSWAPKTKEKIFIASTHWNNQAILLSHWNAAVVGLARHIGPDNIYVSVY